MAMKAFLAKRFSPLNFSAIDDYPHPVPLIDECQDLLPRFYEGEDESPVEHVQEFHALMQKLDIHHEDILMKMFIYSLDGDARKWYFSLPPSSISSLKDFHRVFNEHCKRFYPSESICHNCCEGYVECAQDLLDYSVEYKDENDFIHFPNEIIKNTHVFGEESIHKFVSDENHVYEQLEATVTIVLEMDIFNNYILDEITILEVDHRYEGQPVFDEYSSDDEHKAYPIFDHYEDREYDAEVSLVPEDKTRIFDQDQPLVEVHEEIIYTQPKVNQQSSVDQQPPTSILLPLVPTVYSKQLEVENKYAISPLCFVTIFMTL
jgi:hypothetical protein